MNLPATFRRLLESPTLWQKLLPLLGTIILAALLVTSCTSRSAQDTADKAAPKTALRKTDRKAAEAQVNASVTSKRLAKMGRCLLRRRQPNGDIVTDAERARCINLTLPVPQRALPGLSGKPGSRGPQGLPGIGRPGPRGPRGIPGATPKPLAPIPGPPGANATPDDVAAAVRDFCGILAAPCRGSMGEPGRAPTDDEVLTAVRAYCGARDECRGPTGGQGPPGADSTVPGPQGPPGATGAQGPPGVNAPTTFTFSFNDATGLQHTCTVDLSAGAGVVQVCG